MWLFLICTMKLLAHAKGNDVCDIESVFDGPYYCYGRNNQYMCDTRCHKDEEEVTHTCDNTTGIWSPPFTNKCNPANSACIIDPPERNWGYRCDFKRVGLSCEVWCTEGEEVTRVCDHSTGVWTPPLENCSPQAPDLSLCNSALDDYNGSGTCQYRNSQYICELKCHKDDVDAITHACTPTIGTWSPPITKCKPRTPDLSLCNSALDVYDGSGTCQYRNSQYICELKCHKDDIDATTHACTPTIGTWSPPITKCKPDDSKCDVTSVFNGNWACHPSNKGYKCKIFCASEEDATEHLCDHNTGVWTPPIMTKCAPQDPKDFNWNGCTIEGLPEGSEIHCSTSNGCQSNCNEGYQFSNGAETVNLECLHGKWTYQSSNQLPSCLPVCFPSCQNNGECLRPGLCQCTKDFAGPLCQYPRSNCDINSVEIGHARARCRFNSLQYTCDIQCRWFTRSHTCSYSTGTWEPPIRKCTW